MPAPSGTTPRLALPYPVDDDDVNVSRDIKALASALDAGAIYIVGEIRFLAVIAAPAGWLPANGAALGRSAYPKLYAAIGITFGSGDGSTTFNVPDLRGRVLMGTGTGDAPAASAHPSGQKTGAETITLGVNEMPYHDHSLYGNVVNFPGAVGADGGPYVVGGGVLERTNPAGGGAAHNNVQPSLAIPAYIYAGT